MPVIGIQFGFVQKNVSDLFTDCTLRTTNRQCLRRGFCIIRFLVYPQIAHIHTDWFPIVSVVSNRFLQFLLNHRKQFGSRLFKKHFLKIFNKIGYKFASLLRNSHSFKWTENVSSLSPLPKLLIGANAFSQKTTMIRYR